jgi:hypothetical protein
MSKNVPEPQTDMSEEPVILKFREILNQFKQPYLLGPTEGGGDTDPEIQDMSNYYEAHKILYDLANIIIEMVNAGGNPPKTTDINRRAIYDVFEKKGIFPALRLNPDLKDQLKYYAKLDLVTYPDTFKTTELTKKFKKENGQ